MVFTHLSSIYNDMLTNHPGEVADVFEVNYNHHVFRILFIADAKGRTLFLSSTGENIFTLRLELNDNFAWTGFLDEHYLELCNYLELQYDPSNKFRPENFFEALNQLFPIIYTGAPDTRERSITISRACNSNLKPYFTGWIHWHKKHPTPENIEQTASLIGYQDASRCYDARISSAWSNDPEEENLDRLNEWIAMIENV